MLSRVPDWAGRVEAAGVAGLVAGRDSVPEGLVVPVEGRVPGRVVGLTPVLATPLFLF